MGGREIIDCDLCHAHWHLDCLDPPMAKRPRSKLKNNWICPIHMEMEMTETYLPKPDFGDNVVEPATFIGPQFLNANELLCSTSLLPSAPNRVLPDQSDPGREVKLRRPKGWKVSKKVHGRGFKNNGLIEIENDASDDEQPESQTVERMQEKGIKLDFIDRIKRSASYNTANDYLRTMRAQEEKIRNQDRIISSLQRKLRSVTSPDPSSPQHSAADQEAAHALAELAQATPGPSTDV